MPTFIFDYQDLDITQWMWLLLPYLQKVNYGFICFPTVEKKCIYGYVNSAAAAELLN